MKEKTYYVRVAYEGMITCKAEDAEELEASLWVIHKLFGKPYDDELLEVCDVVIEQEEEE